MDSEDILPSDDMATFKATLSSAKNIIAVAGAGLSAASGIPTFRGAGGMWRKHNATKLATPEAFAKNPSRVWQFYHYRREIARAAQPNKAHLALAKFSISSMRHAIAPGATFTLITQNVDGLSKRALDQIQVNAPPQDEPASKQPLMLEMHGRLFDVLCTSRSCEHVELNLDSPICPALSGTEKYLGTGKKSEEPDIPLEDLPRCSKCKSLARPGVVWFGEVPHHMPEIDEIVSKADLCLVVGTSSTVYPAALYAPQVQENGGTVAVFNMDRSEGDTDADYLFLGPCEESLPEALGMKAE